MRLELDRKDEVAVAWLRITCAIVAAIGSVWLLAGFGSTVGLAVALLGFAASAGMLASAMAGRRRARDPGEWFLDLEEERLTIAEGPARRSVAWAYVQSIDVDEDRLVVRVQTPEETISLEPRYGGLGVYDLCDRLRVHVRK